jgi:hypothetical protein
MLHAHTFMHAERGDCTAGRLCVVRERARVRLLHTEWRKMCFVPWLFLACFFSLCAYRRAVIICHAVDTLSVAVFEHTVL